MVICKANACTGCGVCVDACPKQCITLRYDENGFYKSYVDDDRCVNCGRCANVCPANHPEKSNPVQKAYKARRNNKEAAAQSSSGGIAAVLSEQIVQNGGVVAGCGFDESLSLEHRLASSFEELEAFKGSKYLQSYTPGIYRQVKEQLLANKMVLFVGTPCQVSALHKYLGKSYDNLFTVDFVCHGVSSRYTFDKFLQHADPDALPESVSFRNKTHGYRNKKACFEMQLVYPDKTVTSTMESGFYYWFSSSLSVRESCYACSFVSAQRPSDLTLADYIGKDMDDEDNDIGVSTLFVNTQKGAVLLETVRAALTMEEKTVDDMVKRYNRMMHTSDKPPCRKAFFKALQTEDYPTLENTFDVKRVLPSKMVRRFQAMKRRIRKLL